MEFELDYTLVTISKLNALNGISGLPELGMEHISKTLDFINENPRLFEFIVTVYLVKEFFREAFETSNGASDIVWFGNILTELGFPDYRELSRQMITRRE